MTHDPIDRDLALGRALREIRHAGLDEHRLPALRQAVAERSAGELARRRRRRRLGLALPAALAASIAFLLVVAGAPPESREDAPATRASATAGGEVRAIDDLLDADVSDRQFRALLFGADEANDLLLIAAEEDLP